MMTGRPGRRPLEFVPDEARSLPPPKLTDPRLAYFGFLGYCSGLVDNALRHRPVLTAGEGCAGGLRWGQRVAGLRAGRLRRRLPSLVRALPPRRPCLAFLGLRARERFGIRQGQGVRRRVQGSSRPHSEAMEGPAVGCPRPSHVALGVCVCKMSVHCTNGKQY